MRALPAGSNSDPLLHAAYVVEPSRRRDGLYYPTLTARLLPLRLAVGEATLWRIVACLDDLRRLSASSSASTGGAGGLGGGASGGASSSGLVARAAGGRGARGGGGGAGGAAGHGSQVQAADLPMVVNFMNVEDVDLSVSFKPDASARRFAEQVCAACDLARGYTMRAPRDDFLVAVWGHLGSNSSTLRPQLCVGARSRWCERAERSGLFTSRVRVRVWCVWPEAARSCCT